MSKTRKTQEALRALSFEFREIQTDIRIAASVQWPAGFERHLKKDDPLATFLGQYYRSQPLRFDPHKKTEELKSFRDKVEKRLGSENGVGQIMNRNAKSFETVIHLLNAVGKPSFVNWSRKLWGSAHDPLFSDGTTVAEYALQLQKTIKLLITPEQRRSNKVLSAEAVVELMKLRLRESHLLESIDVFVSDDLTADVAAGARYIKVKAGVMFSAKDIEVLIHHEVFTHVATTLNGRDQQFAKFLAIASPRSTSTQEGLAILMEVFSLSIYPNRLKKILDRVLCVAMAEENASAGEILSFLRSENYSEKEAYRMLARALRGTDGSKGQAFTKDISYLKGLIECFNFVQFCLTHNKTDCIQFLFAGKVSIEDIPILVQSHHCQLVDRPRWVPALFQDLNALSSWFICTSALGRLSDEKTQDRFEKLFKMKAKKS